MALGGQRSPSPRSSSILGSDWSGGPAAPKGPSCLPREALPSRGRPCPRPRVGAWEQPRGIRWGGRLVMECGSYARSQHSPGRTERRSLRQKGQAEAAQAGRGAARMRPEQGGSGSWALSTEGGTGERDWPPAGLGARGPLGCKAACSCLCDESLPLRRHESWLKLPAACAWWQGIPKRKAGRAGGRGAFRVGKLLPPVLLPWWVRTWSKPHAHHGEEPGVSRGPS